MEPTAVVIAISRFVGPPDELTDKGVSPGQNEGTSSACLIECAGRCCYDSYGKGRGSKEYHQHILEVGHGSVLEHASISFYLTMSRGCSHEWVRHRAGCAISQRSTRFVDESASDWNWHPLIEKHCGKAIHIDLSNFIHEAGIHYKTIVNKIEGSLIREGCDKLSARKQARGAARGVLGNALRTEMVWTANIRALRGVLEQRASPFADAEVRLLANRVYEAALPHCPEYLGDYTKVECPDGIGFALQTAHRKV